jgi:hypothetical protein
MTRQNRTKRSGAKSQDFDLVASGSSGRWDVLIYEPPDGRDVYFVQIKGESIFVSFQLSNIGILKTLPEFLNHVSAYPLSSSSSIGMPVESLKLGRSEQSVIDIIRDVEVGDRCYIVVSSPYKPVMRYTVAGKELVKLADAFSKLASDLKEEGLIS